jgi:hypothetical protein
LSQQLEKRQNENPFGVPYNIAVWGDGWGIQRLGMQQYFLHKNLPELFGTDLLLNALNFVLGNHPGENTSSFASGVGSRSVLQAYGVNRADRSFIPGWCSFRNRNYPSRFSGIKRVALFLAANRICDGWRRNSFYVSGAGSR